MDRTTEQRIEAVFEAQSRIVTALQRNSAIWLEVDLTMAQLKTLVVLVDEGPCSISQVADVLGVSLPNASHLVERLVRLELAQRAEDALDRRRTLASVTPKGEELLRSLRQGGRAQMRAALEQIDHTNLQALESGLQALAQALETGVAARTQAADAALPG